VAAGAPLLPCLRDGRAQRDLHAAEGARYDTGFDRWYAEVQQHLGADPEVVFLNEGRNHVLKEGALELMMAFKFSYAVPLAMKVTSIAPDGPEVWVHGEGTTEWVPRTGAGWRASSFDIPLLLGRVSGLPDPPRRELREMLREKIAILGLILHEAESRFDPANADATRPRPRNALSAARGASSGPPAARARGTGGCVAP
jgi:hypothetical protein